jgi:hypothetical protein
MQSFLTLSRSSRSAYALSISKEYHMSEPMKLLIAYDGSRYADAALDDWRRAGLPRRAEAVSMAG